ncbi:RNA-directed DNA polymerase [Tanacetum coccineum]
MKRKLRKQFLPNGYLQEAFLQLHDFAQRDLSVVDYTEEFDHLMLKCEIEKRVKEKDGRKLAAYRISRGPNRGNATIRATGTQSTKPVVTKASHTPEPHDAGAEPIEEEYQEFDSPSVFDEPLEQEDVIYGDTGELLVIRRALAADSTLDSVWRCHHIFHARCTSHGKVCNFIIDDGSCENVVSKTMLKKLSLKTKKHPRPYKLSWLQKGKSVHVDQRCLVYFSIGDKYWDEVWCDVVPMDACHLLLGRQWQFDRRTILDMMGNTYSFDKVEFLHGDHSTYPHCWDEFNSDGADQSNR